MLGSGIMRGIVPSVGAYAMEAASAPLSFLRKSFIEVTTSYIVTHQYADLGNEARETHMMVIPTRTGITADNGDGATECILEFGA